MLICNKGKKDRGEVYHSERTMWYIECGTRPFLVHGPCLYLFFYQCSNAMRLDFDGQFSSFPVDMTLNFKYSPHHSGNNHVTKMSQGNVLPNLFKL